MTTTTTYIDNDYRAEILTQTCLKAKTRYLPSGVYATLLVIYLYDTPGNENGVSRDVIKAISPFSSSTVNKHILELVDKRIITIRDGRIYINR